MPVPTSGYHEPSAPPIVRAFAANAPTSTGDKLYVTIPTFGGERWGPLPWAPQLPLPKVGDECVVGFDDRGNPSVLAWIKAWATPQPPLVSALPAEPADGQEVYYQNAEMAAKGVVWHMRYRAAGGLWEFVGGSPLWTAAYGSILFTGITADTLITGALPLTIPLAGDYFIAVTCEARQRENGVGAFANVNLRRNGVLLMEVMPIGLGGQEWSGARYEVTNPLSFSAGDVLTPSGATPWAGHFSLANPALRATPIRCG